MVFGKEGRDTVRFAFEKDHARGNVGREGLHKMYFIAQEAQFKQIFL